jgi:endonuclease/exonuclease/phosphatase family metal-dependent hydrolase
MLRLLTYNVHRCRGADRRLSPSRIAEVIEACAPDVVALQEVDARSARTGGVDQAHLLARELGMSVHHQPVRQVRAGGWSGLAVLTRGSSRLVRGGLLPALGVARRLVPRGALWVAVEVGGTEVHVVNTHLSLIGPERLRQAEALLGPDWLGHVDCREPRVLLGDFNAVPHSAAYQAISGALNDAQRLLRRRRRPKPTFPAPLPTLRLDHVFVSSGTVRVVDVDVPRTTLTRVASDHLPLVVDVKLVPAQAGTRMFREFGQPLAPALLDAASTHGPAG